jgi:uncharacterized protein YndB with AHSA1/START domain
MTTNRRKFLAHSAALMASVAVVEQGRASSSVPHPITADEIPSTNIPRWGSGMTSESQNPPDAKSPAASRWRAARAVADGGGGTIIATIEVSSTPERVFRAVTTAEVERWWGHPEYYHMKGWTADLRVCGPWSVTIVFPDGGHNVGSGEFAEIGVPRKLVMTRRFTEHPLLGTRETTITYRLNPVSNGTRITVRDEGFIGRGDAAYANAEHWEHVLGWLNDYLTSAA